MCLKIGQIRFLRRQFILDGDRESGPPEGETLGIILRNIIGKRKRYEEGHSRRVDRNVQMVTQEVRRIGAFQDDVGED